MLAVGRKINRTHVCGKGNGHSLLKCFIWPNESVSGSRPPTLTISQSIMHLPKLGFLLTACVAISTSMPMAFAQQPANAAPPPPRLEPLEEGEAPGVTINAPQQQQGSVTQKRAPGGNITETKVTKGRSTYYVLPNNPAGSSVRGDMESNSTRAPQWEVMKFDFRRDKEVKDAAVEAAASTPAPPTQTPPAPAKK